jgi:hypothetical protein
MRNNDIPAYDIDKLGDCFPINTSPLCEGVDKVFYRGNDEMQISVPSY